MPMSYHNTVSNPLCYHVCGLLQAPDTVPLLMFATIAALMAYGYGQTERSTWEPTLLAFDLPIPFVTSSVSDFCPSAFEPLSWILMPDFLFLPSLALSFRKSQLMLLGMLVTTMALLVKCPVSWESSHARFHAVEAAHPSVLAFNEAYCTVKRQQACSSSVRAVLVRQIRRCGRRVPNRMDADQWLELEASLCTDATSKLSVALKEAFPAVTSNYLGTCYPVAMLKAVQWCAAGNASASESPFGELQKRALQDGLDRWQFSVLVLHSTLAVLLLMCAFVLVPLLQFGWLYLRNVPGDGAFVFISPRGNEGGRVSEMPVLLA